MCKHLFILIALFLLACQKTKCTKFYFSNIVLKSIPKAGSKYKVGFDNGLQVEVIKIAIDSTEYAITTPFMFQECESVIKIIYKIDDNYEMSVRLSKTEEKSNIFCSISGINLSKHTEFTNEDDFLRSKYHVYRLNNMNDTIMSIKMNGLKIEEIN